MDFRKLSKVISHFPAGMGSSSIPDQNDRAGSLLLEMFMSFDNLLVVDGSFKMAFVVLPKRVKATTMDNARRSEATGRRMDHLSLRAQVAAGISCKEKPNLSQTRRRFRRTAAVLPFAVASDRMVSMSSFNCKSNHVT